MRAIRCLVAAVLAAGIVTVVAAQPGGGGRGFGTPDVESLVFTNAALQEEIKVTAEQKEKLKPVTDKLEALSKKRGELFSGGKFDKDAFTELQEEGKKVNEERAKAYDTVFNADQKKRLKQIQIQAMAFDVFNDPEAKSKFGGFGGPTESQKAIMKEVQETLKLSDSQKGSVSGIVSDFGKESREIFKEAGIGGGGKGGKGGKGGAGKVDQEKVDAATKKVDKVRKEAWSKIEDLLDEGQKKKWKELVGEPFDVSKLRTPRTQPKKD